MFVSCVSSAWGWLSKKTWRRKGKRKRSRNEWSRRKEWTDFLNLFKFHGQGRTAGLLKHQTQWLSTLFFFCFLCLESNWRVQWHQWKNCKETWGGGGGREKGRQNMHKPHRQRMWLKVFTFFCYIIYFPSKSAGFTRQRFTKYEWFFFKITVTQWDYDAVLNRSSIFF